MRPDQTKDRRLVLMAGHCHVCTSESLAWGSATPALSSGPRSWASQSNPIHPDCRRRLYQWLHVCFSAEPLMPTTQCLRCPDVHGGAAGLEDLGLGRVGQEVEMGAGPDGDAQLVTSQERVCQPGAPGASPAVTGQEGYLQ